MSRNEVLSLSVRQIWMLIATFSPGIGGGERQAQLLSKVLIAHHRPVQVITRRHGFEHSQGLPASELVDGIPVRRLFSRGIGKAGSILYLLGGLWHLMWHGRNGIYHAHDVGAPGWLAVGAKYLMGGHCLIKLRGGRVVYETIMSTRLRRWLFLLLLGRTDRIIVVNSEVERMVRGLGVPINKVLKIPNAVDTNHFRPASPGEKLEARVRLGLDKDQLVVLYLGRLEPVKGVDVLLSSWAALKEQVQTNVHLVIVGDGSQRDDLVKLADSLKIHESISFSGLQQDPRDYYWAADFFVLPSHTEGLSNALLEAMSCGLPVVASNVGGAMDVVDDGQEGFLFKSGDYEELAQKLALMLQKRPQWSEIGTHSRKKVAAYAGVQATVARLDQAYNTMT